MLTLSLTSKTCPKIRKQALHLSLICSLAQGVLRDVESVKDELDRLVEKVRSVKELCNSMNLDDDAEELSPVKDAQVDSLHSVPLDLV